MAEERSTVSVVIPCWNGERYLAEAIASALEQSHAPLEVIVVDDGSTDASAEVARQFAGVTVISQANAGVSTARNLGLSKAVGDFILFLDADDRLSPDAIEQHLSGFLHEPGAAMVFGSNRIIAASGESIGDNQQPARAFGWKEVLMGVTPSPSQVMFRRRSVSEAGGFNPEVKLGEDFDLYLRLTVARPGYCHGAWVADYRVHPAQATKQPSASLASIVRIIRRFRASVGEDAIFSTAERHWKVYYGQFIPTELIKAVLRGQLGRAGKASQAYVRHLPHTLAGTGAYVARRLRAAGRH